MPIHIVGKLISPHDIPGLEQPRFHSVLAVGADVKVETILMSRPHGFICDKISRGHELNTE